MPSEPETIQSTLLDYSDYGTVRKQIFDSVLSAVQDTFPVENERFRLVADDLQYDGPDRVSIAEQKKALQQGDSLERKLTGKLTVIRKDTGEPVAKSSRRTLMEVPYLTDGGFFVRRGILYTFPKQFRLIPGNYPYVAGDDTPTVHFNVKQGTGFPFRMTMDRASGVFHLQIGGRKIPVYALLKQMGVPDDVIRKSWSSAIFDANRLARVHPYSLQWMKSTAQSGRKVLGREDASDGEALRAWFERMRVNGAVNRRIFGIPYQSLVPELFLDSGKKLLKISRMEEDPVSRDNLAYHAVYDVGDMLADKIRLDQNGTLRKQLWKLTSRQGQLDRFPTSVLNPHVQHLYNSTGLAQAVEAINPISLLDQNMRVIRLGEGAVSSVDAAPDESREVQPSYAGYVDLVRSPECYAEDMEVMTKEGWMSWKDVTEETQFACLIGDKHKLDFRRALRLQRYYLEGELFGAETATMAYLVTGNHRMWVHLNALDVASAEYRFVDAAQLSGKHSAWHNCGDYGYFSEPHPLMEFVLPAVEAFGKEKQLPGNPPIGANINNVSEPIPMRVWASFLGWYLSEGSLLWNPESFTYGALISQSKEVHPEQYEEIRELLNKLPFSVTELTGNKGFRVGGKQLAAYLRKFGKCNSKYIPQEIFSTSHDVQKLFVSALLKGDGRRRSGKQVFDGLCTTSKQLAEDFQRLLFQMGTSSTITYEKDDREERYLGCWVVHMHTRKVRTVYAKNHRHPEGQYFEQNYRGYVYCATVPGGLLYVRRNNKSGFWCGNSLKVGLDMFLARNARRGPGNMLYSRFLNRQTGKPVWISTVRATDASITTPEYMQEPGKESTFVPAIVHGDRIQWMPYGKVDYVLPAGDSLFTRTVGTVPLASGTKEMRLNMGGKFIQHAVPLIQREAPLVQTLSSDGKSVMRELAPYAGAVFAPESGVIQSVRNGTVTLLGDSGKTHKLELYEHFPYARKTYIHNTPQVKPGDTVEKDGLIASSNYTDTKGITALGTNARIAYMPYKGLPFEDALVISSSFAKKTTSQHMYQYREEADEGTTYGLKSFRNLFPSKFTREQLEKLTPEGVVKPGTVLVKGDPMIVGVKKQEASFQNLGRSVITDRSVLWEHETPGTVTEVVPHKDGFSVYVTTESTTGQGDKLALPHGSKGVVAQVIPDDDMPRTMDGRPLDLIIGSQTVISRTNPAQLAVAMLGKAAEKTGKPYVIPAFMDQNITEYGLKELEKNGLSPVEDLQDPVNGKTIPNVFVGNTYVYKLQQLAESKIQARETGGYTWDEMPARGDAGSAKHIGLMEFDALLGHSAGENIRDLQLIKGQKNDNFWRQLRLGHTPVMPKTPLVYEKFLDLVRASGVNVVDSANKVNLYAMTNRQAEELTGNRRLQNAATFDVKMRPIAGGLFDEDLTGSRGDGTRWAYLPLPEPVLNPVMEPAVSSVLGVTRKQLYEYMKNVSGKEFEDKLRRLDLNAVRKSAVEILRNGPPSKKNVALKQYAYAGAMLQHGVTPGDFMMSRVPVIPPRYRPIVKQGDTVVVTDLNRMYRNLYHASEDYSAAAKASESLIPEARENLQKAYRELVGTAEPSSAALKQQRVGGVLAQLFGKGQSPKFSFVQRRLLGVNTDLSGMGAAIPDPGLKLNEVGVPEDMAWNLYESFVMRNLVHAGMPAVAAAEAIKKHTPEARRELLAVMKDRPVLMNRAPTLHKYGIMAFDAKPVTGSAVRVNPLIVKPYNLDFDGDCCRLLLALCFNLDMIFSKGMEWNTLTGECLMKVAAGTKICTQYAHVPIENVPVVPGTCRKVREGVEEWDTPEWVSVYSYNTETGEQGWFPVTKLSVHRNKSVVHVRIGKRFSTVSTVTVDHSLVIYDQQTGTVHKASPLEAEHQVVPVIRHIRDCSAVYSEWTFSEGERNLSFQLDNAIGYLFGAIIGDGWVDVQNQAYISFSEDTIAEHAKNSILSANLGATDKGPQVYRFNTTSLGVNGLVEKKKLYCGLPQFFCRSLKKEIGAGAENKTIPWFSLQAPEDHLLGLLDGLLSTDGTVTYGKRTGFTKFSGTVAYDTVSCYLRDAFCYLCRRLGLRTTVSVYHSKVSGKACFRICISTVDMKRFCATHPDFRITSRSKQEKLEKLLGSVSTSCAVSDAGDAVPYPRLLHEAFLELRRDVLDSEMKPIVLSMSNTKGRIARRLAQKLVKAADLCEDLLSNPVFVRWKMIVLDESVYWQEITKVLPTESVDCYDLTVPGPYTFTGTDGVVYWDTLSVMVPVSRKAVDEARQRMMPEKNLLSGRTGKPHYVPRQEYLQGLFLSTKNPSAAPPREFSTYEDALRAYHRGEIRVDDPIRIG